MTIPPTPRCADCGAMLPGGEATCRSYLDDLLASEWAFITNVPVSRAIGERAHFLAVATFNLQHPGAFEPAYRDDLRRTLADMLDQGAAFYLEALRRRTRAQTDGGVRVIARDSDGAKRALGDARRPSDGVDAAWPHVFPITVADVRSAAPEAYCSEIEAWATATRVALDAAMPRHTRRSTS